MAIQDPTVNFMWNIPDVGADFDVWGTVLNTLIGDDGPDSLDSILAAVKATADAALPTTGGTVTGDLTVAAAGTRNLGVGSTDGVARVFASRGSTTARASFALQHTLVDYWRLALSPNTAGDFEIRRHNDAGVDQGAPLTINRLTGAVTVAGDLNLSSGISGNGSGITNLNASNLASGTIPQDRFPTTLTGPGTYRAADGTSAAPSFSFGSDTNTGMYREAENDVRITAGGSSRLRITPAQIQALNGAVFEGDGSALSNLNASDLATGTIPDGRFPSIMAGPGTYRAGDGSGGAPAFSFSNDTNTGMFRVSENVIGFTVNAEALRISASAVSVQGGTIFSGDGSGLTNLNASGLTLGTVPLARVPNLPASQTTSGTFNTARIPNLDASKITTGTFGVARIPGLPGDQITSGTVANDRLPTAISRTSLTASGLLNGGSLVVGPGGTPIEFMRALFVTDPFPGGSIGSHTTVTAVVAVSGAQVGDLVFCTVRGTGTGSDTKFIISGQITSAGQVSLSAQNADGVSNPFTADGVHVLVIRV